MAQNNKTTPPQGSLLLRVIVGGYLVYLAWQIFDGGKGDFLLMLAAGVFAVAGLLLAVFSGKALITSEYFRSTPASEPEEDKNSES